MFDSVGNRHLHMIQKSTLVTLKKEKMSNPSRNTYKRVADMRMRNRMSSLTLSLFSPKIIFIGTEKAISPAAGKEARWCHVLSREKKSLKKLLNFLAFFFLKMQ